MFFILEHKGENNRFKQLGIIVADSIEAAAAKVEMEIESAVGPPDCAASFAVLANNHYLSEMPEIISATAVAELSIQSKSNDRQRARAVTEAVDSDLLALTPTMSFGLATCAVLTIISGAVFVLAPEFSLAQLTGVVREGLTADEMSGGGYLLICVGIALILAWFILAWGQRMLKRQGTIS